MRMGEEADQRDSGVWTGRSGLPGPLRHSCPVPHHPEVAIHFLVMPLVPPCSPTRWCCVQCQPWLLPGGQNGLQSSDRSSSPAPLTSPSGRAQEHSTAHRPSPLGADPRRPLPACPNPTHPPHSPPGACWAEPGPREHERVLPCAHARALTEYPALDHTRHTCLLQPDPVLLWPMPCFPSAASLSLRSCSPAVGIE